MSTRQLLHALLYLLHPCSRYPRVTWLAKKAKAASQAPRSHRARIKLKPFVLASVTAFLRAALRTA